MTLPSPHRAGRSRPAAAWKSRRRSRVSVVLDSGDPVPPDSLRAQPRLPPHGPGLESAELPRRSPPPAGSAPGWPVPIAIALTPVAKQPLPLFPPRPPC